MPVEMLEDLMRAMGYYPSRQEVKNMIDEVKYNNEGNHIDRDDFIRLFVNHRPVYGIGKNNIEEAFDNLMQQGTLELEQMSKETFLSLLITEGEDMSTEELTNLLNKLVGEGDFNVRTRPAWFDLVISRGRDKPFQYHAQTMGCLL